MARVLNLNVHRLQTDRHKQTVSKAVGGSRSGRVLKARQASHKPPLTAR